MASYEKTVDLIAKDFYGTTINSTTVTVGEYFAWLHWENHDILRGKTITKMQLNIYCGQSKTTVSKLYEYKAFDKKANLSRGWNAIDIDTNANIDDLDFTIRIGVEDPNNDIIELYTHNSAYKPYIRVIYGDTPPKVPTSLYPDKTIVNARNVIRFSWVHNSVEKTRQKGFTLQYSKDGGSTWTTVTQTTSNQYYDLPASTLPTTGEIMWRVKTMDQNGLESSFTSAKFNTAIVAQKAPTLISPLSGYLDGSKEITFKWNFLGGTAEDKQSKYDLQYSLNQGSTWTTITKTSANGQHIISENTFKSGNVYWRVRTYNAYGDVSPYSEIGSFYVINSPPIPQITDVANSARPLISWNSVEQQIYELQILKDDKIIFETGTIPSTDRSYRIEDYLEDGEYIAKLRVTNEYSLTSPWAEFMFIIETTKPDKPVIATYNGEHSVTIKTNNTVLKTLVYRDNKCIGELTDNCFIDYTGENNREYRYFIRAIDKNDNFSDSDIKIGKCRFKDNTLALADNPGGFIKLRYRFNDAPKKVNRIGNIGSLVYFDGREYPVTEFTEFKEHSKTLSFSFRMKKELSDLIDLIDKKQTLLYRDIEGENIYGTILSIDYEKAMFGYNVDFTITKTSDYYD